MPQCPAREGGGVPRCAARATPAGGKQAGGEGEVEMEAWGRGKRGSR